MGDNYKYKRKNNTSNFVLDIIPSISKPFRINENLFSKQSLVAMGLGSKATLSAASLVPKSPFDIQNTFSKQSLAAMGLGSKAALSAASLVPKSVLNASVSIPKSAFNPSWMNASIKDTYKSLSKLDFRLSVDLQSSFNTLSDMPTSSFNKLNEAYDSVQKEFSDSYIDSDDKDQYTDQIESVIDPVQFSEELKMIKERLDSIESNTQSKDSNNEKANEDSYNPHKTNATFNNSLLIKLVLLINLLSNIDGYYSLVKDLIALFKAIVNSIH